MRSLKRPFKRNSKAVIAGLLAGLVLLLDALAVCPQLHELFHKDLHSVQHQCAVTLFAQGQVDLSVVEVASSPKVTSVESAPMSVFDVYAPAIQYLPAGRAPPHSSF